MSALLFASISGQNDTAWVLIQQNADLECKTRYKKGCLTVLQVAVTFNRINIAIDLILNKANLLVKDSQGNSLLMQAATRGYIKMAETLHGYGADINETNAKDVCVTPLCSQSLWMSCSCQVFALLWS